METARQRSPVRRSVAKEPKPERQPPARHTPDRWPTPASHSPGTIPVRPLQPDPGHRRSLLTDSDFRALVNLPNSCGFPGTRCSVRLRNGCAQHQHLGADRFDSGSGGAQRGWQGFTRLTRSSGGTHAWDSRAYRTRGDVTNGLPLRILPTSTVLCCPRTRDRTLRR